jgi:hypothetical protein
MIHIWHLECGHKKLSVQHYVIKFVNDLRQGTSVSSTNKTDRHNIT